MQTNNHKIVDYDLVLDQKFGKEGTPERIKAEEDGVIGTETLVHSFGSMNLPL